MMILGECFAPRSRASHRARILGLGLSASIAFALGGCGAKGKVDRPAQGGYIHLFDGDLSTVKKFCDEGRAVYLAEGSYKAGLAVVENAKECSGNAYVAEER